MKTWIDTMSRLRSDFMRTAAVKLDRLARLVGRLEEEPADSAALEELTCGFHGLAGSAGTFGFPASSATSLEGERLASRLRAAAAPPDLAARQHLDLLVLALRGQLADASAPASVLASPTGWTSSAALDGTLPDILIADADLPGGSPRFWSGGV
ncbi:MAG TPA: Hpt domain-containing protein [Thermoanaerobaculia bacterium]|nr:Hpt domain-containing protein [Thermoanaerobaculia bacterium]